MCARRGGATRAQSRAGRPRAAPPLPRSTRPPCVARSSARACGGVPQHPAASVCVCVDVNVLLGERVWMRLIPCQHVPALLTRPRCSPPPRPGGVPRGVFGRLGLYWGMGGNTRRPPTDSCKWLWGMNGVVGSLRRGSSECRRSSSPARLFLCLPQCTTRGVCTRKLNKTQEKTRHNTHGPATMERRYDSSCDLKDGLPGPLVGSLCGFL